MSILGSVGSLYMAILIILLIIGFGLVGVKLINYVLNFEKSNNPTKSKKLESEKNQNINKCLKISLYSFLAILISMIILTIIDPKESMEHSKRNGNTSSMSQSTQNSSQHNH